MALSHLIKYVYNTGSDEVIRRGKKIHGSGFVEMADHDELLNSVAFRVKDDTYNTYYKVNIQKYNDPKTLSLRCTCPYNLGDICRHEAAALLQLQELVDKNMLNGNKIEYNQRHTVAKMKFIDQKVMRLLASVEVFNEAEKILEKTKAKISSSVNERVEAELTLDGEKFPLVIQKNDERNFDTSCKCTDTEHPLCIHKTVLFLQLLNLSGPYYFDTIRNWDKEKNKLLQIYGYSLEDDLTDKFEFIYKEGKPFLKVLDTSIKRVATPVVAEKPAYMQSAASVVVKEIPEVATAAKKLGLVFNFNATVYPYFNIDAIQGDTNDSGKNYVGKVEKLDLTKYVDTETGISIT